MPNNRSSRGEERDFFGTENPCVAGSIPALPIRTPNLKPQTSTSAQPGKPYRRLLRYARPYLLQWIGVSVIVFASSALAVLQPWPVQVVVDHVLDNQPKPAWLARFAALFPHGLSKGGLLAWAASASCVLYGLASVVEAAVSYSWVRVGQRMVYDLARDLFSVTQRQSLRFHAKHPVGDSMSRIMTDSWCVFNIVESLLLAPAQAIITTGAMVVLMLRMSPRLTLASLIVAPAVSLG